MREVVFGGAPREIYIEALVTLLPEVDPADIDPDAGE